MSDDRFKTNSSALKTNLGDPDPSRGPIIDIAQKDLDALLAERDELLNQKDSLLHTCEVWEKRAEALAGQVAEMREAVVRYRKLDAQWNQMTRYGRDPGSEVQEALEASYDAVTEALTDTAAATASHNARIRREALEEALDACADYPRVAPDSAEAAHYDEQIEHSQACIRALIEEDKA